MPHIHDKIDFTASAYIVCGDKVLLRLHDKYHKWLVPGGHIELDQDPIETVIKEVKEEVGLDIRIVADPVKSFPEDSSEDHGVDLQLPIFINRHRVNPTHEHLDFIYAAETDSMEIKPEDGEAADPESFRWMTAEELEQATDISPNVKYHALTALKKVQNQ